jgi:hypothetical protein
MTVVDGPVGVTEPTGESVDATSRGSARRLRLDLFTLTAAAVGLVGAGIGAQRLSDNSFLTHLASGREMLDHGIIRSDLFTWTSFGEPVVLQSWLASLLYGVVDAAAGLWGIRVLMAATAGLLAVLAWRLTERADSLGTRVVIMVPVLVIGLRTWLERPLLIGLVLFAVVILVLEGRSNPRVLAVVGAVWVNVHGSWPLGLVYVASRLIGGRADAGLATRGWRRDDGPGSRDQRELVAGGWLALGCVVGGIVNPYGPQLLFFPVRLLGRRDTLSLITEWKSPSFDTDWARAFLVLVLMAVVAVSRRSRWRLVIPVLVFVAAALVSRRNIPLATLVVLPAAAHGLPAIARVDGRRTSDAIRTATLVMLVLVVALPLAAVRAPHFDGRLYPEQAVNVMEDAGLSPEDTRWVHKDFVGNYLGLRYRAPVAWIDDRYELHPADLVEDYVVLLDASPGWVEVLERHDAEILLWPTDAALTELVREVAGWEVGFSDDDWTVLCRPDIVGCPRSQPRDG